MAYTINDIKNIVQTIANKQERGRIRPDDFNAACAFVNAQLVTEYLGLTEEYRPGQPVASLGPEITRRMKMVTFPITGRAEVEFNGDGLAPFPPNHIYPISCRSTLVLQSVPNLRTRVIVYDIVDDSRASQRLASSISGPTPDHPILEITANGLQRHPKAFGINKATLVFMRYPVRPFWNHTITNGRDVYNPVGSTQFEWPDLSLPQIVGRVLKNMGINFRDADIVGIANQQIQTGK